MNSLNIYLPARYVAAALALIFFGAVLAIGPANAAAKKAKTEMKESAETKKNEQAGIVDSIMEDGFVINDSVVQLTKSILFYDQDGKTAKKEIFKVGDEVLVTSVEDESGEQRIVSITRTKQKESSAQQKARAPQDIKKVNGVWTN